MNLTKTAQQYASSLEFTVQRLKYSLRSQGFSHLREEQILNRYIRELLPQSHPRTVVDIGAGNGVRWSNTYSLFLSGWKGIGVESDPLKYKQLMRAYRKFPQAQACHCRADPSNIGAVLRSFGVGPAFSVLSLDIDGNDYWVLDAILSEFRPGLIVTEINEKIPPPLRFVVKYDPDFQLQHHFYGYSISTLQDLCEKYNYGILELEYNNAFIAPRELGDNCFVDADSAYRQGYLLRSDRQQRFASNLDVEAVQSLNPQQTMRFFRKFYSKQAGKYHLTLNKESLDLELINT
jgi:hypothetical protein